MERFACSLGAGSPVDDAGDSVIGRLRLLLRDGVFGGEGVAVVGASSASSGAGA